MKKQNNIRQRFRNLGIKELCVVAVIGVLVLPYILTRNSFWFSFDDNCGFIGDTIGGITAPVIGIISILLLYKTLSEQIKFNREQKGIEFDEQFKSTLFNLLQAQRDLATKMSGTFPVFDKYGKIKSEEEKHGLEFFTSSKKQLKYIYLTLERSDYGHYDEYYTHDIIKQFESEEETLSDIIDIKEHYDKYFISFQGILCSNITDIYGISNVLYKKYQKNNLAPKNIAYGYVLFYRKYEQIGPYFRHMYRTLKFIRSSEEERVSMGGRNISEKDKEKIRENYKDFAQFIQAQMSVDELTMLYYNSLLFPKMRELVIYYQLLENLRKKRLIKKAHACIPGIKFKEGNNIIREMINSFEQ